MRILLVVPRYERKLLAYLQTKFADDPDVTVMEDRRLGLRRKKPAMRTQDRRRGDRRGRNPAPTGAFVYHADMVAPEAPSRAT